MLAYITMFRSKAEIVIKLKAAQICGFWITFFPTSSHQPLMFITGRMGKQTGFIGSPSYCSLGKTSSTSLEKKSLLLSLPHLFIFKVDTNLFLLLS